MKIETIGTAKVIVHNPESFHNYFAWPTVARLQNGKIAVVCSGYRVGHICPFGKAVISYSEDEGETYTKPAPVIDTLLDDRDSGIVTFGDKGVLVTSFNINWNCYLKGGYEKWYHPYEQYVAAYVDMVTDEQVEKLSASRFSISQDGGMTFSREYKAPVMSPHGPTVLKDGTILWVGTNYQFKEDNVISAYRLHLDGTTEYLGRVADTWDGAQKLDFCEPHAIELDDGTILCQIRTHTPEYMTLYQTESKDGGRTWTKPHRVLETDRSAPAHLLKTSTGMLVSAYGYRGDPAGIRLMFSSDNGATWDRENILFETEGSADLGYPSTIELDDGTFLTVFYAHVEEDGPALILQQKWEIAQE